jgi:hypothetical protein
MRLANARASYWLPWWLKKPPSLSMR